MQKVIPFRRRLLYILMNMNGGTLVGQASFVCSFLAILTGLFVMDPGKPSCPKEIATSRFVFSPVV
jgi:hypothetical protein